MKSPHRLIVYILIASFVITGIQCNNSQQKNNQDLQDEKGKMDEDTTTASDTSSMKQLSQQTKAKFDMVLVNNIPSPLEILRSINQAELQFAPTLVHDQEKVNTYVSPDQKSLMFGVYGADLGYLTLNDKTQSALDYFKTVQSMAEDLGVRPAFSPRLVKKFNNYIGQKDSMVNLIYGAYDSVDAYLRSHKRLRSAALVLVGGWVEGMYITTKVLQKHPRNDKTEQIYKNVWGQQHALKNIRELINELGQDERFAEIRTSLKKIQSIYKEGKGLRSFDQEKLKSLSQAISQLRTSFIKKSAS